MQVPEEDPLEDDDCAEFGASSYYNRPITRGMSQALYSPPCKTPQATTSEGIYDVDTIVHKANRNGEVHYVVRCKGCEVADDIELSLNRLQEVQGWKKLLDEFQEMEMCRSLQLGLRVRQG